VVSNNGGGGSGSGSARALVSYLNVSRSLVNSWSSGRSISDGW
jgi:hypothetical protein